MDTDPVVTVLAIAAAMAVVFAGLLAAVDWGDPDEDHTTTSSMDT